MKIAKLLNFSAESFTAFGHDFKEHVVRTKYSPEVLLQLLAFNGTAHVEGEGVINVENWDLVPADVLEELRMTLFISYQGARKRPPTPGNDGTYTLTSVGTTARVQAGGVISLPDYAQVQRHATNRRVETLIGEERVSFRKSQ
jgi:hypothetical protein